MIFQSNFHSICMQHFAVVYIAFACILSKICVDSFEFSSPFLYLFSPWVLLSICSVGSVSSFLLCQTSSAVSRADLYCINSSLFYFFFHCPFTGVVLVSYFARVLSLLARLTISYKWFDIFIKDLNEGLEEIIFKFIDDTINWKLTL